MKHLLKQIVSTISALLLSLSLSLGEDLELSKRTYEKAKTAYSKGEFFVAFNEFKKYAEQGEEVAQFYLASMFEDGKGVTQDHKEAVKWYTLSAEQGTAGAQNNLGVMYFRGQGGLIQDSIYAHIWSNLASSNGDKKGGENRDNMAKRMTPSQIEKAQDLARECVKKNYKGC